MNFRQNFVCWGALCLCMLVSPAQAVVQQADRLEVDWARQKVRFFGEAKVGKDAAGVKDTWRKTEQAARYEAMQWVEQKAPQLLKEKFGIQNTTEAIAALKAALSHNTIYAKDGMVRIVFDSPIADVLGASASALAGTSVDTGSESGASSSPRNTGFVVKVAGVPTPIADYRIVDEDGKNLFDASKVQAAAFKKNLLGRWVKGSAGLSAKDMAGPSPAVVRARLGDDARTLVVSRKDWDEAVAGNRLFLSKAELILSMDSGR